MIDKLGAGHYQTRDDRPVVILCLDAPGRYPVVGYIVSYGTTVPAAWDEDGMNMYGVLHKCLIPVPRKQREVWLYAGSVFKEAMAGKEDFLVSVKHSSQPGYVCFREVMEGE